MSLGFIWGFVFVACPSVGHDWAPSDEGVIMRGVDKPEIAHVAAYTHTYIYVCFCWQPVTGSLD